MKSLLVRRALVYNPDRPVRRPEMFLYLAVTRVVSSILSVA
jgi:hypothetical protein